jgi:hypothetical protein
MLVNPLSACKAGVVALEVIGGRGRRKETGCRNCGRVPRVAVACDIGLRRPRTTQGCRADDDNDDDIITRD